MDSMKIIPESGHSSVEKMNSIVNQLGLGFSTAIYFLVTTLGELNFTQETIKGNSIYLKKT